MDCPGLSDERPSFGLSKCHSHSGRGTVTVMTQRNGPNGPGRSVHERKRLGCPPAAVPARCVPSRARPPAAPTTRQPFGRKRSQTIHSHASSQLCVPGPGSVSMVWSTSCLSVDETKVTEVPRTGGEITTLKRSKRGSLCFSLVHRITPGQTLASDVHLHSTSIHLMLVSISEKKHGLACDRLGALRLTSLATSRLSWTTIAGRALTIAARRRIAATL